MADPIDRIHDIIQTGEDDALSKIADILGMTDVERERDRLSCELAALKRAVVEACVTTSLSSVNVRWINERVIELMRESDRAQER